MRVLKPGGCFAGYEWCATDQYDPKNEEHRKVCFGDSVFSGVAVRFVCVCVLRGGVGG